MIKYLFVYISTVAIVFFFGCNEENMVVAPVSTEEVFDSMPDAQAESLILEKFYSSTVRADLQKWGFKFKNMTTREMWDSAHFQLYQAKITYETVHYIIYKGVITCLDRGLGSMGIHSNVFTDIDRDGKYEFIYSYIVGSGYIRTVTNAFRPKMTPQFIGANWYFLWPTTDTLAEKGDSIVEVTVITGRQGKVIGRLKFEGVNKDTLGIDLYDSIPEEFKPLYW